MIRERPLVKEYQIKQRKKVNIDVLQNADYDQFQGNLQNYEQKSIQKQNFSGKDIDQTQKASQKFQLKNMHEEIKQYERLIAQISKTGKKYKKVSQTQISTEPLKKQQSKNSQIKIQSQVKSKQSDINKVKSVSQSKIKKEEPISSNWKNFLQKSKIDNAKQNNYSQKNNEKSCSQFVALDCEFVKCGQIQQLARLSIVDQQNKVLYDSYIKPINKITDYVTQISGITFSHIKKAPLWKDQIIKVKKILINKILIGHTIQKDLQILNLKSWNGIRKTIDIADFSHYKQKNGKLTSLKNLAQKHLNKKIQDGWHSSVQDSIATMDLFKIHKKTILKQNKII